MESRKLLENVDEDEDDSSDEGSSSSFDSETNSDNSFTSEEEMDVAYIVVDKDTKEEGLMA